jgi:hypothetical protein
MSDEMDNERLKVLAGITKPGEGFTNQRNGCVMDEGIDPATAKDVLRRIARHVKPGDWDKAVEENPEWKGFLSPDQGSG